MAKTLNVFFPYVSQITLIKEFNHLTYNINKKQVIEGLLSVFKKLVKNNDRLNDRNYEVLFDNDNYLKKATARMSKLEALCIEVSLLCLLPQN